MCVRVCALGGAARAGKEAKAKKLEAAKEAIGKKREALQAAKPILTRARHNCHEARTSSSLSGLDLSARAAARCASGIPRTATFVRACLR